MAIELVLTILIVTAVSGLAVATAPEFAHYIPFFLPLASGNFLGAGLAICLAAAIATTLFMGAALFIIQGKCRSFLSHGWRSLL
jgi:calcium permeable stress-gated cation channel